MPEVPATETSLGGPAEFATRVWREFVLLGLSADAAAIATAHAAGSSGWGRSILNYNVTGMKAYQGYRGDWHRARGFEMIDDEKRYAKMKWQAFKSLAGWARAMIRLLQRRRYALSYAYLLDGDPAYFAQVGLDGWYTADPAGFDRSMRPVLAKVREYVGLVSSPALLAVIALLGVVGVA